ncbi:outer membrane beta-barrel protein [Paraliomyxa miuraensis]|uniref:outer membrane beta-barrel protein n=1 Tax=Paraliomyxa miuraensis TaxID=376150 RepID=UPI00225720B5|nr:outer membrane beta-barrel protein [Paraliomyxa miuraensis]MCX4246453.1 porin [Paraliomyxa miuraensis]
MPIDLIALTMAAATATATAPTATASTEPAPAEGFGGFSDPSPAAEPVPAPDPREATREGQVPRTPTWVAGAFVDVAYLFNSNFPGNHIYAGAVTHPRTGEITLPVVAAYVRHEASEQEPWRFELALHAGAAVDALYAGEPTPGRPASAYAGPEVWKHIALANGGYRFASGTELDAGLMSAPIGVGAFWSKDNWTFSPAWSSNAVPYYLMGARLAQPLAAGFSVEAWVVNGWQTIGDVNRSPSGLVGLYWSRGDVSAVGQVFFGPEQEELAPDTWMVHGDTQVIWDGRPVGVAAVFDVGREGFGDLAADSLWMGGGVWVRGFAWEGRQASLVLVGHPEVWWDRDGRSFGVPQLLASATAGPSLYFRDLLQLRLEYRYDRSLASDGFFFRGDALALANEQHNLMLNLLAKFERPF